MKGVQVDFALLLYDEFDGAAISDANVLFRRDGRIVAPLRKSDGFYVFCKPGEAVLEIRRPHYHTQFVCIDKSGLAPTYPVVRERLLRADDSAFSACEWLRGHCPANSAVVAFAPLDGLRLGALDEDGGRARISLIGYGAGYLTGKRVALDAKGGETFALGRMLSPNVYQLDSQPRGKYKSGTPVYRAYLSRGRPDGSFSIPVDDSVADVQIQFHDKETNKWVQLSATAQA